MLTAFVDSMKTNSNKNNNTQKIDGSCIEFEFGLAGIITKAYFQLYLPRYNRTLLCVALPYTICGCFLATSNAHIDQGSISMLNTTAITITTSGDNDDVDDGVKI